VEKRDLELIERILPDNEELRILMEEHKEFENKLKMLQKKKHLSMEEEIEKKKLKKLKLAGMDRIAEILSMYKNG
jgi:uncharacterized protein YdcH (DUF465 family)